MNKAIFGLVLIILVIAAVAYISRSFFTKNLNLIQNSSPKNSPTASSLVTPTPVSGQTNKTLGTTDTLPNSGILPQTGF